MTTCFSGLEGRQASQRAYIGEMFVGVVGVVSLLSAAFAFFWWCLVLRGNRRCTPTLFDGQRRSITGQREQPGCR